MAVAYQMLPQCCAPTARARPRSTMKMARSVVHPGAAAAPSSVRRTGLAAYASFAKRAPEKKGPRLCRRVVVRAVDDAVAAPSEKNDPNTEVEVSVIDVAKASWSTTTGLAAAEVVRRYYEAVNSRNLEAAMAYVSPSVLYEDLALYAKGLASQEAMRTFLSKWLEFPDDVTFVIDDMLEGDPLATGVTWHLEVAGKAMPFSRGVSFYRTSEAGQIVYGRDQVEPPSKSGEGGVAVLKALFPLIRKIPADTANDYVPPLPQALPAREGCALPALTCLDFYEAVNRRDIDGAIALMGPEVAYEDLQLYAEAKRGRDGVRELFAPWGVLDDDVLFVVDDVTAQSAGGAATAWHLEVGGVPMPFSRGVSFYRTNAEGEVAYARDVVEPPAKPGDLGMTIMAAVFPLVRAMPKRFEPVWSREAHAGVGSVAAADTPDANKAVTGQMEFEYKSQQAAEVSKTAPEALLLWGLYALYWGIVLLGRDVPGIPLQETQWETIEELIGESLNFFYVNPFMHSLGITFIPSPASHPVNEALFNFVNAWSLMFAPLVLNDSRALTAGVDRTKWWFGQFFLTNIFFIPFMALRGQAPAQPAQLGGTSENESLTERGPVRKVIGATGASISVISVAWALAARPEFGDLAQRLDHLELMLTTDRVYFAFVLDMVLYSLFQAKLMSETIPEGAPNRWLRFVPFFGLSLWLWQDRE